MAYHSSPTSTPAMPAFQRFDPADCHFPCPRVPILPSLRWSDVSWNGEDTTAMDLLAGPSVRHFARGRYAMHAAYQAAGVGPAGALLAPAYHCRTMLDPALALGGALALYRLNTDLTPQLESIRALVASSNASIKALVVTHYFGIAQPQALMDELAALCQQYGITLVEDCSHAWQVAAKSAVAVQTTQRHVLVASPYKFFACEDGGVLWGNPSELPAQQTAAPGWLAELKAVRNALQRSMDRQKLATPSHSDDAQQATSHLGQDSVELSSSPSSLYDRHSENNSSMFLSRWVMRHTRLNPVAQKRQHNYRQWAQLVNGLRGVQALFPDLPPGCTPYMFAMRIDRPKQYFYQLKHLGLPIWRWDEMAVSDCPVSIDYRLHLLHLPCHQSLTSTQMQWMLETVKNVLC